MNVRIRSRTAGVTLLELLIVVSIIAVIASISFPAMTAGLAGVRLSSAAGTVASFLTSSMNTVERHEQAAADRDLAQRKHARGFHRGLGRKTAIEARNASGYRHRRRRTAPLSFIPGGAFPGIAVVLRNEKARGDPFASIPSPPFRRSSAWSGSRMKQRHGFTLLEVLVATVIMGIAVTGLIVGLSQSVRTPHGSQTTIAPPCSRARK